MYVDDFGFLELVCFEICDLEVDGSESYSFVSLCLIWCIIIIINVFSGINL